MKKFTKYDVSIIKSTAKALKPHYEKLEKLQAKVNSTREDELKKLEERVAKRTEKIQKDIDALTDTINSFEEPVKTLTGGYTSRDLLKKETLESGKTVYTLVYGDTVVPVDGKDEPSEEQEIPDGAPSVSEPAVEQQPEDIPEVSSQESNEEDEFNPFEN